MKEFLPLTTCHRKRNGFSLMELLVVVAIIGLMSALSIPAFVSATTGRSLAQAIALSDQIASAARMQSIRTGKVTALVLSQPDSSDKTPAVAQSQSLALLTASNDGTGTITWTMASPWTKLPRGIQISPYDRDGTSTFYSSDSTNAENITFPTTINGKDLANCVYILFLPDGSVSAPTAGPAFSIQRAVRNNTTADYLVVIQEDSGRVKIISL